MDHNRRGRSRHTPAETSVTVTTTGIGSSEVAPVRLRGMSSAATLVAMKRAETGIGTISVITAVMSALSTIDATSDGALSQAESRVRTRITGTINPRATVVVTIVGASGRTMTEGVASTRETCPAAETSVLVVTTAMTTIERRRSHH